MRCLECDGQKFLSVVIVEFDNVLIKEIRCVHCKEKIILIDEKKECTD